MINNLLLETRKYVDSQAYYSAIKTIALFYQFNADEEGMLVGRVNALLTGMIKEENFLSELMSELEIPEQKAKSLEERIKKEIVAPFKAKLISVLSSAPDVPTAPRAPTIVGFNASTDTLRQQQNPTPVIPKPQAPSRPPAPQQAMPRPAVQQPGQRPAEPMTKEHILSQIENPPRTVIKRYVIEHEPIEDVAHLIDDKVDSRPKLQDHYTD